MIRAEGRAGLLLGQRTEQISHEEAILTTGCACGVATHGDASFPTLGMRRPGSKQALTSATIGLLAKPAKNVPLASNNVQMAAFILISL